MKRKSPTALKWRRFSLVGKSDGFIFERTRENQSQMSNLRAVRQNRATSTEIMSVLESPRGRSPMQLLLPK